MRAASPEVTVTGTALRQNYRDSVRPAAREEILAEMAEEAVTARLHAETARFHHSSTLAHSKALGILLGEHLDVAEDKQATRAAITASRPWTVAMPGPALRDLQWLQVHSGSMRVPLPDSTGLRTGGTQ